MKIYCRNRDCVNAIQVPAEMLDSLPAWEAPYAFNCKLDTLNILKEIYETDKVSLKLCECMKQYTTEKDNSDICVADDCIFNENKKCIKKHIEIVRTKINNEDVFNCKNYSLGGFTGRINLMNYIPKDGQTHIDDSYSEVLDHDNKVSKSFPTHLRQKKESKSKKHGG
jgi:hypothetical protein